MPSSLTSFLSRWGGGHVVRVIPGHEIEYPMAWVILGGLVTSTGLNLFLLPTLYAKFGSSTN